LSNEPSAAIASSSLTAAARSKFARSSAARGRRVGFLRVGQSLRRLESRAGSLVADLFLVPDEDEDRRPDHDRHDEPRDDDRIFRP
jgi:hypothetical protein